MFRRIIQRVGGSIALLLAIAISSGPVFAGITVTGADGITVTGADGVQFINTSGITVTGADSALSLATNGITTSGITVTGADALPSTGADSVTYTGPNAIYADHPNGVTVTGADGITVTGADGITVTGADGSIYRVDSAYIRQPNGITVTGADGITVTGADGINRTSESGITVTGADGILGTGVDGITVTGADGITVTGADGQTQKISPNGVSITGPAGITVTGADGITVTGADGITVTGADGYGQVASATGLLSVDPQLAFELNQATDDSNVNAVVAYHTYPTDADLSDLQAIGVVAGTRYRALPLIALTATRRQLVAISRLTNVRSIYGNRTLQSNSDVNTAPNNSSQIATSSLLTRRNNGLPLSGKGVTVAVLDTGVDGTQSDLAGRVVQNVKLADTQSLGPGFLPPVNVENQPDTDLAYGHGTFVAGLIAGNGLKSGGKFAGLAPGAQVVGLSAGDLNLSFVLAGFDYILSNRQSLNIRIVNCSFSANTVFDYNDPVNIATKLLTDAGINVVFSAGNNGAGPHTLNPYAVAPWVVSVGATDNRGRLAAFSSRGDFGSSMFQPTVAAPGVAVASLRATGINVTGTTGLGGDDLSRLSPAELPFYTTGTGTSFSAPQVAGTIALMLEANPQLTPADVKDILKRTATPMAGNYAYEVGAGMLNAYGAVTQAAFPDERSGVWRAVLGGNDVRFITDPAIPFSGSVTAGGTFDNSISIPQNTVAASVEVGWGSLLSASDIQLSLYRPNGTLASQSSSGVVPGLTGGRKSLGATLPVAGTWKARLTGGLGTGQNFSGQVQLTRVQYGQLNDINSLTGTTPDEVLQLMRSFVMEPVGNKFRSFFGVSRLDSAAALVRAGLAPQYLPPAASFTDDRDDTTRLFVESVQAVRTGSLFLDAKPGGAFRPDDPLDRLTAAVILVRAAGLAAEADAKSISPLPFSDCLTVSSSYRGYIATAIAHGFLSADSNQFHPSATLTRGQLAHALVAVLNQNK